MWVFEVADHESGIVNTIIPVKYVKIGILLEIIGGYVNIEADVNI